ncbi:MAG TPA: decaprenyl-phosphate phosphoribosyltransferase [Thermomicrobiales bacterium]|nr:decaprenyl-phosphate phosphoribosyltransferase [Thermomicrobiales bacterium]
MIGTRNVSSTLSVAISTGIALLRLARPQQWVKNAVVLAGMVFAALSDRPSAIVDALVALLAFIAASSAIYVANDLRDMEADRHHPLKRTRPLATGAVQPRTAAWFAVGLVVLSLAVSVLLTPVLALTVAIYLLIMTGYNRWFKQVPILDVTVIAFGFVLRAVGGAVAVGVPISPWLLLCAFLLALFLGFGKRRAELIELGDGATRHRQSLGGYTAPLLDQLVAITAVSALVTYAVYTVVSRSVPANDLMLFTVPFVAFAIFRYLFLVYGRGLGGSPESLLFRDGWLLATVALWGIAALVIVQTHGDPSLVLVGNDS